MQWIVHNGRDIFFTIWIVGSNFRNSIKSFNSWTLNVNKVLQYENFNGNALIIATLKVKPNGHFSPNWYFRGVNWIKSVKIGVFDPQNGWKYFEFLSILTTAKNHISNFADSPYGPDYCSSSNTSQLSTKYYK